MESLRPEYAEAQAGRLAMKGVLKDKSSMGYYASEWIKIAADAQVNAERAHSVAAALRAGMPLPVWSQTKIRRRLF